MVDDPIILNFFADAKNHDVGHNGMSFPVRNRTGAFSLVSFTSDHSSGEWTEYKRSNISKLQLTSSLIDSAASFSRISPSLPVSLSKREEQCVILTAKGKNYDDIAEALNIDALQVRLYLDTMRHKLGCINVKHAIAVAIATGVIPAIAVKGD
jgi:LuxR family transcriptional regulator, quorum-sensing system regulator RaiR